MKRITNRYYVVINAIAVWIILLLLASCAQVLSPGGGPRDFKPPKAISYEPDSAQLRFDSEIIEIKFDEFIQLKDLNDQLVISPPLETTPDITVKNKTLVIRLDKKEILEPNTTYCISFGNSIQDITETNTLPNFKYIFSTGNFIDSLTLSGKVQNALTRSPEKSVLVMLYNDFDDSVVYKKKPAYFAKTYADGSFYIGNIKKGKYKLFALKDANTNYKYDDESEGIGFVDTLIDMSKSKNISLSLFQEPAKRFYVKKARYESFGKILFVFNKSSDSLRINPIKHKFKENEVLLQYSKNKDTLHYWIRNINKDSLKLQVMNGNKIIDTAEFAMMKKEDALKSKRTPLKLSLIKSSGKTSAFDLKSELNLTFNSPIEKWDGPILLKEDTLDWNKKRAALTCDIDYQTVRLAYWDSISGKNLKASVSPEKSLFRDWKENTDYHLFIPPGTFTDIFGLTNDTIKIDFKTREEKYYGTVKLKVNVDHPGENYIIQLLDEKENVVRENNITASETLSYEYLHPKKYKLKVIYDKNNNNKWDSGDYFKKQQPEKVMYNWEPVNIRSNWDLELEWKIADKE